MDLSQKLFSMPNSPIYKFYPYAEEKKKKGVKVYQLNIGQPDIKTPKAFFDAIHQFNEDVLAYGATVGDSALIEAIQGYYKKYGMDYEKNEILITDGGSEALTFVMASILNPEDEVIIPEPYYSNYTTFVAMCHGNIRPLTTYAEDGYRYADPKAIEALITPKTKAILCTNPGNPTGYALDREEMRILCDIAVKHDIFLVADEVYREFVYDGRALCSFGQFPEAAEHVVIIDSVSKRFSACGARVGSVLTKNRALYDSLMKLAEGRLCCATMEQIGAIALYNMDLSYFDAIKKEYEHRRNVAYDELCKIEGIVCQKPSGSFYITAKLPVESAEDFLLFLLTEFEDRKETVMFSPAEGFYGTPGLGKSEIRIAYVLKEDDLRRALELIRLGLDAYKNR